MVYQLPTLSKQHAFWLQELRLHVGQLWLAGEASGQTPESLGQMIGYGCSNNCKSFYAAFGANGKEVNPVVNKNTDIMYKPLET